MDAKELAKKLNEKMIEATKKHDDRDGQFQYDDYYLGFVDGLSDAIGVLLDETDK